jgi:RNA recognition motif-containing protein
MIIILEQIPERTKKSDIVNFFSPVLRRSLFQKPGKIKQIKIPVLKDSTTNLVAFYGLVFIEPRETALRAIKKLNRKFFVGKHIAVREYIHRSDLNDRRKNAPEWNNKHLSKRIADRRKANLKVRSSASISYSSY